MANIKKFGITGVGDNVRFSKTGGRIRWSTDHFEVRDGADSALVPIRVGTPSNASDATPKSYVDGLVQGLSPKDSVRVATTTAGTLATSFEDGDVIDGVTLVTGDRILIKDQSAPEENGIYVVQASGAPVRAEDANTAGDLASAFTFVEEGTQANTGWVTTFIPSDVLGTDPVVWVQFSSAGAYTASNGITLIGNDFQLDLNGLGATSITSSDFLVFYDVTGGDEAKITTANFISNLGIVTTTDIPSTEQAELAALDALGTGMVAKTADATYAGRTITVNGAGALMGLAVTNGSGVSGNPTIGLDVVNLTAGGTVTPADDYVIMYDASANANVKISVSAIVGAGSTSFGTITPSGNSNATSVVADSGADTLNVVASDGIQVDGNDGTNTITISFTRSGLADTAITTSDTIPFFDASNSNAPEFRSTSNFISDLNILTTADIPSTEQAELAALDALGTGMVAKTADATYAARTITAGTTGLEGINVTNGSGVSGNPTIGLDITGLTADGTLEDTDEFPYYNGTNNRKVAWSAIKSELANEVPGVRSMAVVITYNGGATQVIGTLPDDSRVLRVRVDVNTAWNATETIDIGINGGAADALMDDTENDPEIAGIYESDADYLNTSGGGQTVEASVTNGNTPSQGSALVVVEYINFTAV